MESSDDTLTVLLDDFRFDDERYPVLASRLPRLESEHGKTTWQARDTTKDRFKRFGEMMGNEVLEDLDSRDPRLPLVRYTSFATDTHDHLVVVHAIDKVLQRVGEHLRIGVDLTKELRTFSAQGIDHLPSSRPRRSQESRP